MFYSVRRALAAAPRSQPVRRASAALYCLAACRLVSRVAYERQTHDCGSRFVLHVPSDHGFISAVIATALFGGRLEFRDDDTAEPLRGRYIFTVNTPTSGDWSSLDFERTVFGELFRNDAELPDVVANTGPLPDFLRAKLRARLATIRHVERQTFALVVPTTDSGI